MSINKIKNNVIKEYGRDPFVAPDTWSIIEQKLPNKYWHLFNEREGATKFLEILPQIFVADEIATDELAQTCWERIGNFYKNLTMLYQALSLYDSLYRQLLIAQDISGNRLRKGTPLVWMNDCYTSMNYPVLAKRCIMLALCENAVHENGRVPPESGTYWRLIYRHGLPDSEIKRYGKKVYELWENNQESGIFPEWLMQQLDKKWMVELPSPIEAGIYTVNIKYIQHLIQMLGDKQGKVLETIADYVLSCMPGCRTSRRKRSRSSEYDIVCALEGVGVDFRTEFGRYFVCECKDWKKAVDFSATAKFCRVLDSIRAKFGILFSPKGISGSSGSKYAENERRKIFHERSIVLVVVDLEDLKKLSEGESFISLLRKKYEQVRLDID